MIKNLFNLSNKNIQYSFILNYRGVGEKVWGKQDDRGLNKWNKGKLLNLNLSHLVSGPFS